MIVALEIHNWPGLGAGVFPSKQTLTSHGGLGWTALTESLERMEGAGLIEIASRHRWNGSQTSNAYTRKGLSKALTLLARTRSAGVDPTRGLGELLAELRREGELRQQRRLEAGHTGSERREAEQRRKENNDSSLNDETNLLQGHRKPNGREERRVA